jgi:GDP-4-dehydro-6-deoxy-D-mannose reductase
MKALVTGGDGFVGRHLLEHLRSCGDDAVGVDRECDVTDVDSVIDTLSDVLPNVIYHLAALTAVGASWSDPVEYTRVNVLGTKNVLDAAHEVAPASHVVIVSSSDVYGVVRPEDLPLVESFRVAPSNPYASSKVEAERVAYAAVREHPQRVVIARPFNHLGPGQSTDFVVPAIVDRLLQAVDGGADEIAVGDLSTRRDFTDVRDVVRAYRLLGERASVIDVYNIASGVDVGLFDIAQRLVAAIAPHVRLITDESLIRPVEIPVSRGSYEKLHRATRWRPEISLDTTLHDIVEEMRRRRRER